MERCATRLKEFDVAVDVVNFGILRLRPRNKFQLLKDFVSVVDNGGNSRYLYAPSGSPTPLWQQILESPLAPGPFPKLEELKIKQRAISYYFRKRHFFDTYTPRSEVCCLPQGTNKDHHQLVDHPHLLKRNRPNPIIFPDGDGDGDGNGKHRMGIGITIPEIPQPVAIPSRGREK
ncbi:hypothetical protein Tco_1381048 [Tanacetum coccineum]